MRRVVLALLGSALLLAGCSTGSDQVAVNNGGEFRFVEATPAGEVLPPGERAAAPEFSGTLLDGEQFSSTELDGDVAVLNFWAHWCGPCRLESPEFQEIYEEVRADGVQFLGVNVKDTQRLAEAFVERHGLTFPSLFDPRSEVTLAFRDFPATAIPSTIVLDRESRVAAVYTGVVAQDDLRAVIDSILAEEG